MADQSLLHSPINPHFFQPILTESRTHLNIPVAFFSKHVEGRNNQNKTVTLRSDASDKTWLVKMDGLKLTDGWEDFAFAHDLRTGDIVVFRLEGEMVFHVTALGPSCCEIQYHTSSHNINDDDRNDQINIASRNSSRVKKNPRKKVESSLDHSRFVAKVSAWCLSNDRLYIPLSFARLNGLNKINSKKIYLQNEEGRSWKLVLRHDKSGMQTFVQSGWRRFCSENGIRQGQYTFKLVRKSAPPVIRLCRAKAKPKQRSVAEYSSDHSCFEGSVTPSSLRNDLLYLPRSFVNSNRLDKRCSEIVLKNEQGVKWPLVLKRFKSVTYLPKGWTSFCQVNRIKAGDSFKFKLVGTWKKPVLSLCPTQSNNHKTPLECSEGNKSEESEEDCLEVKKKKYWSRCRASVENMDDDQTNIGNSSKEKRVKKNPVKKAESSSDHSSFVANVTASSLNYDRLYLPLSFVSSNGLDKMNGKEIVLLNEEGLSWKFNLKYNQAGKHTYVRPGWSRFCDANGMSQGQQFTFKLVQKHGPPVMYLSLSEHRPKSESSSHRSYFVGSVTASSIKKDKLYLWKSFVSSNGLDKGCKKIILKNKWGREWKLVLKHYKSNCFTIIKRGWTSFCQGNGLKAGDSFKFKLVGTGEKPVLSLCPAESSHEKIPLECPEGIDDVNSLSSNPSSGDDSSRSEESEEENMEDKNISQDCLETKKRKYCSSSSYSQNRFVTLTLTRSAFQTYKLFLPRGFTQVNGINKPRKITLLGQDGVKKVVDLYQESSSRIMRFGKGWREFFDAQGVKIDDSFVLELIWEKEASPVLKFCTKVPK
ncbi:transcriptional factor B3 family protein [Arabidopsis thaliana]|uniref:Transcriptional factor B3 family protein n=1 Tax=Arabidopsis thaliana TaxID=3702 RepID=A0A1P8AVZ8_ARATH|nr:transcriptional factor B3 family protein [Arabidopsis thaliana]ANM60823.1 transcriptional factor B3 family protein [Arabidopsis thaliana]|eukprot:NP_001323080.1 transcriptional factor B3 family protein [Arabidopsis thaliana]